MKVKLTGANVKVNKERSRKITIKTVKRMIERRPKDKND